VKSKATPEFWQCFDALPPQIQALAGEPASSVAARETFIWTWIGSHEEYNKF
jgi:hypothetical protein